VAVKGRESSNSVESTSKKGTFKMQALNKSGFIFKHDYATKVPPAEAPLAAIKFGCDILYAIRYSAQAMKSLNEFAFLCSFPYSCQ
jgi:hypothetical protein